MNRVLVTLVLFAVIPTRLVCAEDEVRFSRDVLPLLADRCFHCHGPDPNQRKADLRLDLRDEALKVRGDAAAVIPGNASASEVIRRITSPDADTVMPPAGAHRKSFSAAEIQVLTRWIDQGAPWGRHWAYELPVREPVPDNQHPVDFFVRRRLAERGLSMSAKAESHTLLRRLHFDLTGLPPTPEDHSEFLKDRSAGHTATIQKLLESPHYGERMAMWWLDAARYADTDGFQQDATRRNWPWRDWVIQSFNDNRPFDELTVEQIAGDLLPGATVEQQLATCFHRNHMTNGEGGRDPEESRIDYVIDRVNTTGTVWLGMTLGCCQCHSHKFDPVSQEDYYRLFAFFNSIDEDGRAGDGAKPYLDYTSPHAARALQEAEELVQARTPAFVATEHAAGQEFETWLSLHSDKVRAGFSGWQILRASHLESAEGTVLTPEVDGTVQASGPNPRQDDYRITGRTDLNRITGLRLEVFPHASHTGTKLSRGRTGEFILTDVKLQVRVAGRSQLRDIEIAEAVADVETDAKAREYGKVRDTLDDDPRNGWTTAPHDPLLPHRAVYALAEPLQLQPGEELVFVMLHRSTVGDASIGRFRISVTDQPGPAVRSVEPMPLEQLAEWMASGHEDPEPPLRQRLLEQFLSDHAAYQLAKRHMDRAVRQRDEIRKAAGVQKVMVLAEREQPRETFVLERGLWDKHGKTVTPGVPETILPLESGQKLTRLDLARWIVDRRNPLTARVIVNQLWQLCFGTGLVRTPEDFGLQGEFPTHPELLDWLAVEFVDSGWDVKHMLHLITTSDTWQQSSRITNSLRLADPENRLLSRGARFRLPSWMIRDAALQSSGLLNPAVGGPPVMPYQPDGVWAELFMGRFGYDSSQGRAQHRRTVYAFWRRSAAPTFLFDSAQRRTCEVRPHQTNTPLHALTLLNDESMLEAAREAAKSAVRNSADDAEQVRDLFQSIMTRLPNETEQSILLRELQRSRMEFVAAPESAVKLLSGGQPEHLVSAQPEQTAACMIVASLIYNLDEAMTHE